MLKTFNKREWGRRHTFVACLMMCLLHYSTSISFKLILKQRLDQNLVAGAKLEAQLGNSDGRKTKKKKGKQEMGK
jgi:hypothetical protein